MMFDIFSSFDPQQSLMNSPLLLLSLILLAPSALDSIWMNKGLTNLFLAPFSYNCKIPPSKTLNLKGMSSMYASIFFLLLFLNWSSLIPYSFSLTSHMLLTASIALPSWLANILSSLTADASALCANFIPSGAPGWLAPALLLIEITSTLVRPLTLSFRLAANLSTGHVMLTIMGAYTSVAILHYSLFSSLILLSLKMGYLAFEVGIATLQAYIFCLLLTLYTNEHPSTSAGLNG